MLLETKSINTIKSARRVHAALMERLTQDIGSEQANHFDWMCSTSTQYKANGLAWWRDRCQSAAMNIVHCGSLRSNFIQPSPETLAWGGFLGGEYVSCTDEGKHHQLTVEVSDIIRGAR